MAEQKPKAAASGAAAARRAALNAYQSAQYVDSQLALTGTISELKQQQPPATRVVQPYRLPTYRSDILTGSPDAVYQQLLRIDIQSLNEPVELILKVTGPEAYEFRLSEDDETVVLTRTTNDLKSRALSMLVASGRMRNLRHVEIQTAIGPHLEQAIKFLTRRDIGTVNIHFGFHVTPCRPTESAAVVRCLRLLADGFTVGERRKKWPEISIAINHDVDVCARRCARHSIHDFQETMWGIATREFYQVAGSRHVSVLHTFQEPIQEVQFLNVCNRMKLWELNVSVLGEYSFNYATGPANAKFVQSSLAHVSMLWSPERFGLMATINVRDAESKSTQIFPIDGIVALNNFQERNPGFPIRDLAFRVLAHRTWPMTLYMISDDDVDGIDTLSPPINAHTLILDVHKFEKMDKVALFLQNHGWHIKSLVLRLEGELRQPLVLSGFVKKLHLFDRLQTLGIEGRHLISNIVIDNMTERTSLTTFRAKIGKASVQALTSLFGRRTVFPKLHSLEFSFLDDCAVGMVKTVVDSVMTNHVIATSLRKLTIRLSGNKQLNFATCALECINEKLGLDPKLASLMIISNEKSLAIPDNLAEFSHQASILAQTCSRTLNELVIHVPILLEYINRFIRPEMQLSVLQLNAAPVQKNVDIKTISAIVTEFLMSLKHLAPGVNVFRVNSTITEALCNAKIIVEHMNPAILFSEVLREMMYISEFDLGEGAASKKIMERVKELRQEVRDVVAFTDANAALTVLVFCNRMCHFIRYFKTSTNVGQICRHW